MHLCFFSPTIKHLDFSLFWNLVCKLPNAWKQHGVTVLWKAINHPAFGGLFVSTLGIVWMIFTAAIALGFKGMHTSGFKSAGETIIAADLQGDGTASFLMTYVLPLLTDDLSSLRSLIVFLLMLYMIIVLLINSNTFYHNPILTALKYKVVTFKFQNPDTDIPDVDREYIGITRGTGISEEATIKRKHISDGVFLIYNA